MSQLNVIVSVDWEPDHGLWKWQAADIDYGGILKGTPAFCGLLDELGIPCTWFIETSYDAKRNLPGCFPEVIRELARREQDEIGLHIHWRRATGQNGVYYETADGEWLNTQLDHGVRQLDALGARPRCFRSGALLHVQDLPRMLCEKGFAVDSSTLWGQANRLQPDRVRFRGKPLLARFRTLMHRTLAALPEPYITVDADVEQRGNSEILELPITYSLLDARSPSRRVFCRFLRQKALMAGQTQYLMLFFHIDELTSTRTGPDQKTEPDEAMLEHFRGHLKGLKNSGAQFVTCSEARKRWLEESLAEAQEQPAH